MKLHATTPIPGIEMRRHLYDKYRFTNSVVVLDGGVPQVKVRRFCRHMGGSARQGGTGEWECKCLATAGEITLLVPTRRKTSIAWNKCMPPKLSVHGSQGSATGECDLWTGGECTRRRKQTSNNGLQTKESHLTDELITLGVDMIRHRTKPADLCSSLRR